MALVALQRAVVHRRPPRGLIIHSDRGVQYACTAFAKWVNDHGFVQSMSRKGDCWDNAVAESFFHLLKLWESTGRYCQLLWMEAGCSWRDGAAEESVSR